MKFPGSLKAVSSVVANLRAMFYSDPHIEINLVYSTDIKNANTLHINAPGSYACKIS